MGSTGRKPRVPVLGSLTWIMDPIHQRCMVVRKGMKYRVRPTQQQEAHLPRTSRRVRASV